MERLTQNLKVMQTYNPYFVMKEHDRLIRYQSQCIMDESTGEVSFPYQDNMYRLFSINNRQKEIDLMLSDVDLESKKESLIIVHGLADGEHLRQLRKKINPASKVFVLELNYDVLSFALNHYDLTDIFNDDVFFLMAGEEQTINTVLMNYFGLSVIYNLLQNMSTITIPNYYLYEIKHLEYMKQIKDRMFIALISKGNSLEDIFVGFDNSYKNVDAHIRSHKMSSIHGKYVDKPGIIVSAGPSLDKNIHLLKEAMGKALIITTDASYDACIRNNVLPDAMASVERDEPTYTYYYKDKKIDPNVVLIGPGELWDKIYEEYPGQHIIYSRRNDGLHKWWSDFFEDVEFYNGGHSSATVAFMAAAVAGCNPIILIGQDLAYTNDKKHANESHTEMEGENSNKDFDGIYLKDYEGKPIKSHMVYKMFKTWFEYQIKMSEGCVDVIDATEGGAYIEGSTIMTLRDTIDKYCIAPVEKRLNDYLVPKNIEAITYRDTYQKILNSVRNILIDIDNIQRMASDYDTKLEKIEEQLKAKAYFSENSLKELVLQMQKGNEIIQRLLYDEETLSPFFDQIIRQTILHVKGIGNSLTKANVEKNLLLQRNLMYIIKETPRLLIEKFKEEEAYFIDKLSRMEAENGH